MLNRENRLTPSSFNEIGKTALYYEYTSVDVKEKNVIETTLTALLKDPDVTNENIRKVTYYLVQKFFIKSVHDKKEDIDLISQIPEAFKKMIDTLSPGKVDKHFLVKYLNIYLKHTMATQEDQANLFEIYYTELKEFRNNLNSQSNLIQENSIHNKEAVIEQIYEYLDSIDFTANVKNRLSKDKARKKVDQWIFKIFDNHVIKGALDVIIALEDYCLEEVEQSKKRIGFLKKYSKLNLEKISKEIINNRAISTIKDGWPVISENVFIYIDNLTKEHGDYKKFLEEIFSPVDVEFDDFFFSHFFLISAYQKQTEKDIYLLEKTFKDIHLIGKFKNFFTGNIHNKIKEGQEKVYSIENHFIKSINEIKGLHKNTFAYLTLKYLLEDTLDKIKEDDDGTKKGTLILYKRAFTDFIRPKYPKFLDNLIFVYLKQSKDLERKVGNTKKAYNNIYEKDTALLESVFAELGLREDYNRSILPCITGFEQSNQILKRQQHS